ncbi:MAG: TetR/AcrR family transcriptional regulator [Bulleidia sp.]
MAERGNTKKEILEVSLDLFSKQGFEATSISQIAQAVGIRKASLYSHYESKQAILDALVESVLEQYNLHSILSMCPWKETEMNGDTASEMILGQMRYIMHDPHISKARKMLVIAQYQNREMAELLTRQNYTDVMHYFEGMVGYLIDQGILVDGDQTIMAAQLCLPVSEWINLCDRQPEMEEKVQDLVNRHVHQFFRIYGKNV